MPIVTRINKCKLDCKENIPKVDTARKEEKWGVYRDGRAIA
jgi:hypothetical protein